MLPKRGAPKRSSTLVGSGANDRPARTSPLTCPRHQPFWKVYDIVTSGLSPSIKNRLQEVASGLDPGRGLILVQSALTATRKSLGVLTTGQLTGGPTVTTPGTAASERMIERRVKYQKDWFECLIKHFLREKSPEYGQFTCEALNNNNKKEFIFFHTQIITHINVFVVGVSKER